MTTRTVGVLAMSSLILSAPAAGQTQQDPDEQIDQIIVTGARTPLDPNRIGSAHTVISRDQIEMSQARYVTDLLRAVPGFAISHTGAVGAQTQVRVRGSEANHVLVLIDGVRANDPATSDEFRWEHLATNNIERIEIVRGPQSALWGSDAVAAVVHVITSRDTNGGQAYAESGSNNAVNVGAGGNLTLGTWTLGAAVDSQDTDGVNISRAGSEEDGSDLVTASLSASTNTSSGIAFDAGVRFLDAASQFDPVDFVTTGLPTDGDRETLSDTLTARIGASLATDRIAYRVNAQYYDSEHRNRVDGAFDSSTAAERLTLSVQADIELGGNQLSLAAEHGDTDFEQRGAVIFGDPNQDQDLQVTSAIAEYQFLAGERFSWILSGRFDSHSDFDDALTGKLSVAYELTGATRLRASIGSGHKTPTFTERFGFFPDQFIGNPDLKPETSVSVDLGVDQDWLDGALTLQASVFAQELEDEINGFVFDPATFLSTAANRPGTSDRSGAEIGVQWRLSDRVRMNASYTYTDSDEQTDTGDEATEIRRPRHMGSLSLSFQSAENRFHARLSADYGGSREDRFFPPFPQPPETVTLTDYWLVDLTAHYQLTPALTLFARGTNLLDGEYEQVLGYRTLGRAGYVGVRTSFGR